MYIVWTPSPLFLKGEVNFNYLPQKGGHLLKIFKKRMEVWHRGREGGRHVHYLFFSRFIIFAFQNYFTLCEIVIHLKKNYFFLPA